MKRVFIIEYPDEYGELWLNKDTLMVCLHECFRSKKLRVEDITVDVNDLISMSKEQVEANKKIDVYIYNIEKIVNALKIVSNSLK